MKKKCLVYTLLFSILSMFLLQGCSALVPYMETPQPTVVFQPILVSPKEYVVVYDEPVVGEKQTLQERVPMIQKPVQQYGLPDAGDVCRDTLNCKGFCLSFKGNVSKGFCSDTRYLRGCYWLLHQGNASQRVCY
jgi:hypothetical protein